MKAIVIHHYGPPDVLTYQDVPDPQPRAGEIRIRVHAATVNRVLDVSLRAGKEGARGPVLPLIPGVDCAGIVDAVGPGVTKWRTGMRVAAAGVMPLDVCPEDDEGYAGPIGMMGIKRPGGFAEMVAVPACAAIELPGGPRLPPRRGGHAPRADRVEPAVQRRRAQGRRDRAGHGRRRQSRLDRHPDRQERDRRQGDRGRRLRRPRADRASSSAPITPSTTTPTTSTPR